jgi:hypothetical protein
MWSKQNKQRTNTQQIQQITTIHEIYYRKRLHEEINFLELTVHHKGKKIENFII